jgi:hypothetical protein
LDTLLGQLNAACPGRSKVSDGSIGDAAHATRDSDHNPWYGPGIVTARDYTHDPAHGLDIALLAVQLAGSGDTRIKYIIANGLIWSAAGANARRWVKYAGANAHTKHLHLSVVASPACDNPAPWNLPMLTGRPASGGATQGDDDMAFSTITEPLEPHLDPAGVPLPVRRVIAVPPVGTSLTTKRAFLSIAAGWDAPQRVRVVCVARGQKYLHDEVVTVGVDNPWGMQLPAGTAQVSVEAASKGPVGVLVELLNW